MEYVIGFALGAAVCIFAKFSGFDRERVFSHISILTLSCESSDGLHHQYP